MQSETGFPSSHQLTSYVASKSRLKLAARAVLSADAGLLVNTYHTLSCKHFWHIAWITGVTTFGAFILVYISVKHITGGFVASKGTVSHTDLASKYQRGWWGLPVFASTELSRQPRLVALHMESKVKLCWMGSFTIHVSSTSLNCVICIMLNSTDDFFWRTVYAVICMA